MWNRKVARRSWKRSSEVYLWKTFLKETGTLTKLNIAGELSLLVKQEMHFWLVFICLHVQELPKVQTSISVWCTSIVESIQKSNTKRKISGKTLINNHSLKKSNSFNVYLFHHFLKSLRDAFQNTCLWFVSRNYVRHFGKHEFPHFFCKSTLHNLIDCPWVQKTITLPFHARPRPHFSWTSP